MYSSYVFLILSLNICSSYGQTFGAFIFPSSIQRDGTPKTVFVGSLISSDKLPGVLTHALIKLDKQIEKYFRTTGSLLFGFHDIITEVKVSTNELVNKMIQLRTDLVDFGLYSTCTLVKHFDNDLEVHPKIEWKNIEENYHLKKTF